MERKYNPDNILSKIRIIRNILDYIQEDVYNMEDLDLSHIKEIKRLLTKIEED